MNISTRIHLKKRHKSICLITESTDNLAVISLAQALSELNCKVDVIAFKGSENNVQTNDQSNFNLHVIENKKIRLATKRGGRVIKYVRSIQNTKPLQSKITEIGINFDLIISNMYLANITCRRLGLPNTYYCIHSILSLVIARYYHNTKFFKHVKKSLYLLLVKKLYKNQKLITVSKGVENDLTNLGIQPKSIQTIYNPLDFNNIKKQSTEYLVEEKDYIVYVGRFSREKRHDVLINAYKESGIKQKLLLLGDENNEIGKEIKHLIKNLGLQNKVIFKGFKSNPFPYIKNAKVLVLSSDHEGFGMVLAEALVLKTPIVSTACVGPNEILFDELEPFLSPVGDSKALAGNIKKMVENPIKITDKYIDKFSAEKSAKQYLALCSNTP